MGLADFCFPAGAPASCRVFAEAKPSFVGNQRGAVDRKIGAAFNGANDVFRRIGQIRM
jgi:hypothetical protein